MIMNRRLSARMKASPYSYAEVARSAGIARETLLRRLERDDWRRGEIVSMAKKLPLTRDEVLDLFFYDVP